jgi:hypothetical protein
MITTWLDKMILVYVYFGGIWQQVPVSQPVGGNYKTATCINSKLATVQPILTYLD